MQERIVVRLLSASDEAAFVTAVERSRSIHHPWVSPPDSSEAFHAYLERMERPDSHAFLVCLADTDEIAGVLNITNVVMGPFCSGYLSYYVFAGHERQGLMREGL